MLFLYLGMFDWRLFAEGSIKTSAISTSYDSCFYLLALLGLRRSFSERDWACSSMRLMLPWLAALRAISCLWTVRVLQIAKVTWDCWFLCGLDAGVLFQHSADLASLSALKANDALHG